MTRATRLLTASCIGGSSPDPIALAHRPLLATPATLGEVRGAFCRFFGDDDHE